MGDGAGASKMVLRQYICRTQHGVIVHQYGTGDDSHIAVMAAREHRTSAGHRLGLCGPTTPHPHRCHGVQGCIPKPYLGCGRRAQRSCGLPVGHADQVLGEQFARMPPFGILLVLLPRLVLPTSIAGRLPHTKCRTRLSATAQEVDVAKSDIAALLAVAAALMIGIGDVIQQRSAQDVTDKPVGTFALFGRLLRDRRWWAGSLVAAAGFALQAAALGLGSVVLVQALSVSSLLFALLINAKVNNRRITRCQWTWAVLLAAAVAMVVTVGNPQAGHARAPLHAWAVVAAVMGPALILCVIGARILSGSIRAALLGLVSGSLWGVFSALTKGVVDQLAFGIWALLRTPELYAWAVLGISATAWEQSAFRAGPLTASLPAVSVSEPVVASILGVTVLDETLNTNHVGWIVLGVSVAVMAAATVALARSQAAAAPERSIEGAGANRAIP